MLTHWHGVPTQMLLLESTTGRAWWDMTPPQYRLGVGLLSDSKLLFWWFAWSLVSCQISPEVCTNLSRCQVEWFLRWKLHGNISLTNSAKFYILGKTSKLFNLHTPFKPLKSCPTGIWNAQLPSYWQLLSEINMWRILQGLFLCWEKQDGIL